MKRLNLKHKQNIHAGTYDMYIQMVSKGFNFNIVTDVSVFVFYKCCGVLKENNIYVMRNIWS